MNRIQKYNFVNEHLNKNEFKTSKVFLILIVQKRTRI